MRSETDVATRPTAPNDGNDQQLAFTWSIEPDRSERTGGSADASAAKQTFEPQTPETNRTNADVCAASAVARPAPLAPFLKYAGGKSRAVAELMQHVPPTFGTYHEPFVGGGSLFFHLRPEKAILADKNIPLIRTYSGVRDSVREVLHELECMQDERSFFDWMKTVDLNEESDAMWAAWFIAMNRWVYNGMYRVNEAGKYNLAYTVPAPTRRSSRLKPAIERLPACSAALQGVAIIASSFETVLDRAVRGDFVYLDPPYVPLSVTSSFVSYNADGFGMADHLRLRDVARELKEGGVSVLLSNSGAKAVKDIYGTGFDIRTISVRRSISCNAATRGAVEEVLIT